MRTLPKLEQEIVEQIEEAWAKPQGVGEKRGEDSCSLQNNLRFVTEPDFEGSFRAEDLL
jgi:hypothetical protein